MPNVSSAREKKELFGSRFASVENKQTRYVDERMHPKLPIHRAKADNAESRDTQSSQPKTNSFDSEPAPDDQKDAEIAQLKARLTELEMLSERRRSTIEDQRRDADRDHAMIRKLVSQSLRFDRVIEHHQATRDLPRASDLEKYYQSSKPGEPSRIESLSTSMTMEWIPWCLSLADNASSSQRRR